MLEGSTRTLPCNGSDVSTHAHSETYCCRVWRRLGRFHSHSTRITDCCCFGRVISIREQPKAVRVHRHHLVSIHECLRHNRVAAREARISIHECCDKNSKWSGWSIEFQIASASKSTRRLPPITVSAISERLFRFTSAYRTRRHRLSNSEPNSDSRVPAKTSSRLPPSRASMLFQFANAFASTRSQRRLRARALPRLEGSLFSLFRCQRSFVLRPFRDVRSSRTRRSPTTLCGRSLCLGTPPHRRAIPRRGGGSSP